MRNLVLRFRRALLDCAVGPAGTVLCEVIGEPIKRLAELIGEPIKLTGIQALRKALGRGVSEQPQKVLTGKTDRQN